MANSLSEESDHFNCFENTKDVESENGISSVQGAEEKCSFADLDGKVSDEVEGGIELYGLFLSRQLNNTVAAELSWTTVRRRMSPCVINYVNTYGDIGRLQYYGTNQGPVATTPDEYT